MAHTESLLDIPRRPIDDVIKGLRSSNERESRDAGLALLAQAAKFSTTPRQYLTLAVDRGNEREMSGWELCLEALKLPIKDDLENGVLLQLASDTFATYPGTRALFPEVIDDMLRWLNRQEQFERVAALVASSRTIAGTELLSTVVTDDSAERSTFTVAELGRIPVRSIKTSEQSVRIWKIGSGIRTSYEFNRRARLELIAPFANRIARELETTKVAIATTMLVSGDGVNAAAPVVTQSSLASAAGGTHVANTIVWDIFLYWLVQRAKANTPVDTVVGNWDSAFKWAKLWMSTADYVKTPAENFSAVAGNFPALNIPLPTFALSSTAPAGKLIGMTKGETLEELIEAGSQIQETSQEVLNQSITYLKTENTGYRLVWGDTRSIYDYGAA